MDRSQYTILVVDDDEGIRSLLTDILVGRGYRVLSADNGRVGVKVFRDNLPEITILDLRMPVMDGFEFLEQIRPTPESPFLVVVLTGIESEADQKRCFELGSCVFMRKLPSVEEILSVIDGCIRRKFVEGGGKHVPGGERL